MDPQSKACLWARKGSQPMLLGVRLDGDLRGMLFEARVEQRFRNATRQSVEVIYTFPLPWDAVLLGVDVVLGGKQLTGAIVENKAAAARYEDTLSDGHAAILLERNADRTYSLNLGNLAAGEDCAITLRYAQTLKFEQRGLRLMIPTVIAPRYGDPERDGGLQPHQVPKHSLDAEYPFDLELRLHGELAHASIASPSHPISITPEPETLTVSLARQGTLDRDFVLVVDRLSQDSIAVAAPDRVEPGAVAMLASFSLRGPSSEATSVAVKVLVDCSSSMAGDSIEAARRALQAIIDRFQPGDRFSLSRFGSEVRHRSRGLWKVTDTTKLAAKRWVAELEADLGGTEMDAALKSTFALGEDASDVLLVTDGEIHAIERIIDAARRSGHRIFVVGIGSSPAESHLRRLAEATGGACDFVAPGEAVERAVLGMFARLRPPQLRDVVVEWPQGVKPRWVSPPVSAVFDGDTVHVFALLDRLPDGPVRLLGRCDTGFELQEIGRVGVAGGNSPALPRLVASARLQASDTDDAVRLAVAHQLVTDRTSFVLVHERADAERALDMPTLHQVEQMIPAGWGGIGTVRFGKNPSPFQAHAVLPLAGAAAGLAMAATPLAAVSGLLGGLWRRKSAPVDHDDSRHLASSPLYQGLTPQGLQEWLRKTPAARWPRTYAALREIGVGTPVIDWLDLWVAICDGANLPESEVVVAFLTLVSRSKLSGRPVCFIEGDDRNEGGARQPLLARLRAGLDGMTASDWPTQVLALEEPGMEMMAHE